jgi:hypothetical protein
MLEFLKGFFNKPIAPPVITPEPVAPYKIEAVAVTEVAHASAPVVETTTAKRAPAKPRQIVNPPTNAAKAPAKPKTPRKPKAK